ncbi:hypothetical protein G7K_3983-t1 [Saitoella complicata NRRL Y-17804]|uniref:Uncharacterized protein n=1 Tax=Saitoella complicata (strain BCRC 22490 / CBS 7301 / JCM 7358 / NBRC 10748 / NRRL Y-17804) TaxID=698492 RepID=A0A0E9NJG8_SAICN|nr:hypothetical protein G7K_3983-t1 [Saitoella complicata NRRL Y-17804]
MEYLPGARTRTDDRLYNSRPKAIRCQGPIVSRIAIEVWSGRRASALSLCHKAAHREIGLTLAIAVTPRLIHLIPCYKLTGSEE